MTTNSIPVVIGTDPGESLGISSLPKIATNLFQRIIRNPRPETPYGRERECTEMLAAVLLNAPALRKLILRWLAIRSNTDLGLVERAEVVIETERFAYGKRVDLWIEGHTTHNAEVQERLVWAVEVKVGAAFHRSPVQIQDDCDPDKDGETLEEDLVQQLKNYDRTLAARRGTTRHGFVIALCNLADEVRQLKLKCKWTCLSWTDLGLELKSILSDKTLPADEAMLGAHLLGFISNNLWRIAEMPTTELKLDFNDIALIHAFKKIGSTAEEKANALTAGLQSIVNESGIGFGKVVHCKWLYRESVCSIVTRSLVPGFTKDSDPYLEAGIGIEEELGDMFYVWIVMSPRHLRAEAVRRAVTSPFKRLQKRDKDWFEGSGELNDWGVLGLYRPLTSLLAADDQQATLNAFVTKALRDLKQTGAIDAITKAFGRSGKQTRGAQKR